MLIFACDICKKRIKKRDKAIEVRQGFKGFTFCEKCAKPVEAFLKKCEK